VDLDQLPRQSHLLLQLPPHFESFPYERCRFIKHGTHTSTYQTHDSKRMSNELSHQDTGTPLNPIPTIVNGTPLILENTMIVVSKTPIITIFHPIVNTQPISINPFGSLSHSLGYNVKSIPMASSPFSYGMSRFTLYFLRTIPAVGPNASIELGGTTPPYNPFSFGGSQIPQMTATMGGIPYFNLGSNPLASRWSNQPCGKSFVQVHSYTLTSSVPIPTNTFGMKNPLLSFRFTPEGG